MALLPTLPQPNVPVVGDVGRADKDWYDWFRSVSASQSLWIPVLTCASPGDLSVTYQRQDGRSVRIGPLVFWSFVIEAIPVTHSSASGQLQVTGLPYFAEPTGTFQAMGALAWGGFNLSTFGAALWTDCNMRVTAGTSLMAMTKSGSNAPQTSVQIDEIPSNGGIPVVLEASGFYRAA